MVSAVRLKKQRLRKKLRESGEQTSPAAPPAPPAQSAPPPPAPTAPAPPLVVTSISSNSNLTTGPLSPAMPGTALAAASDGAPIVVNVDELRGASCRCGVLLLLWCVVGAYCRCGVLLSWCVLWW